MSITFQKRASQLAQQVMIVEDDPVAARVLESTLAGSAFCSHLVASAEEALAAFQREAYPVVIVDLHLPGGSGTELIQELNNAVHPPIILVHTVEKDTSNVIETMKLGVYDYLIKPVNDEHLFDRLNKAFEVFELRRMQRDLEKEREIRVRKQLSWNLWKETLIFRNGDRFDQSLFNNL
ncbi:MAG: response regulator, partial [Leptospiraceae bacterium]|nr:response regulator [Leptospiraceae bacterium]